MSTLYPVIIRRPQSGDVLSARHYARSIDSTNRNARTPPIGTLQIGAGQAAVGCQIIGVNLDTLEVKMGTHIQVLVAKPWVMRSDHVIHDGHIFTNHGLNTRTANGTTSQEIVPKYLINDHLFIMPVKNSGLPGVKWIDLNVDGRMWADS